jgi:TRAP-type mannitol/chloroaromatic compound transport system permease small subunit
MLTTFIRWHTYIQETIGRAASWLTLLLALIATVVVILRYGFNTGSIALQESLIYLHATAFMLGASYAWLRDAHVRVDVFYARLSRRRQLWLNLIGTVFLVIPMFAFILWSGWDYVAASWAIQERSTEDSGLPYVWLLKTLIVIMPVLMLLQALAWAALYVLSLKNPAAAEPFWQALRRDDDLDKEAV